MTAYAWLLARCHVSSSLPVTCTRMFFITWQYCPGRPQLVAAVFCRATAAESVECISQWQRVLRLGRSSDNMLDRPLPEPVSNISTVFKVLNLASNYFNGSISAAWAGLMANTLMFDGSDLMLSGSIPAAAVPPHLANT